MRPAFISMGSMSDPYNPFEKDLELTRHALELIEPPQITLLQPLAGEGPLQPVQEIFPLALPWS